MTSVIEIAPNELTAARRAAMMRSGTEYLREYPSKANPGVSVTPKAGKRGKPFRRIVSYSRSGPFHREVGIRWLHGESWPMMETYFVHRYLHATKGFREYCGGPSMRFPIALPPHHQFNQPPTGRQKKPSKTYRTNHYACDGAATR